MAGKKEKKPDLQWCIDKITWLAARLDGEVLSLKSKAGQWERDARALQSQIDAMDRLNSQFKAETMTHLAALEDAKKVHRERLDDQCDTIREDGEALIGHRDRIAKLEHDLGNLRPLLSLEFRDRTAELEKVVAVLLSDRTAAAEERELDKRIEKVDWQQMSADNARELAEAQATIRNQAARIRDLVSELNDLKAENDRHRHDNQSKGMRIGALLIENEALKKENAALHKLKADSEAISHSDTTITVNKRYWSNIQVENDQLKDKVRRLEQFIDDVYAGLNELKAD